MLQEQPPMERGFETAMPDGQTDLSGERAFLGVSALLFLASIAGTIYECGSMSGGMPMPGGWTMSMMWMQMPGQTWFRSATSFLWMWIVMMAAMMLPSFVPLLHAYRRSLLQTAKTRRDGLTALVSAGYFSIWTLFGAVTYPLGVVLAEAEMRWSALSRSVPMVTGIVVLLAGIGQFTTWKTDQLGHCRSTSLCLPSPPSDARSAWQYGLRLGVHCLLCCFGFMMTLLLIGVMDLRAMAIVTVAITLERLAPNPQRVARLIGAVAIVAGLFLIARALRIT